MVNRLIVVCVCLVMHFVGHGVLHAKDSIGLLVHAEQLTPANSVVRFPLPETILAQQHLSLIRKTDGKQVPMQIDRLGGVPQAVWLLDKALLEGESRNYQLSIASHSDSSDSYKVKVKDDNKHLWISVGDKKVLRYNHAIVDSPLQDEPYYARSGYIHPVYSPKGEIVTDDFNPDHAHQHGIMFAWRQMNYEGRSFDGWNQKAELGKVEHTGINCYGDGPVFGYFSVEHQHVDLTAPEGPLPVLLETWNVLVYAIEDYFLFDIESIQRCATDKPVTIEKIHYGGMMIRGHAAWHGKLAYDYLTSEGKTKADGNHTRPQWVDIAGKIAGEPTGVTIFDHTENFRYPQPVRLHPKMPYFCFAPAVLDSFEITPGEPYVSKYRFCVHQGSVDAAKAELLWRNYTAGLVVEVIGN